MSRVVANEKTVLMEQEFLPFTTPTIGEDVLNEVRACLTSGWIATGPRVQQFEQDVKAYTKASNAIAVNSATSGLHLALVACGVQPGDEVITTPLTFVSTVNVIEHAGGRPVFVDIEPGTYNIDAEKIRQAITPRTKVIMPVHFAGLPVDLDPIYELARAHGIRVIEDAAHAIGASYKGRSIGSFGDIQVFSFHPCKNMTTGEGGVLTVQDDAMAARMRTLRFHGIDRDSWNRYGKNGSQTFDVIEAGFKYNMSDLQAAIGIPQLKQLDVMNQSRLRLVKRYQEALAGWQQVSLPQSPDYEYFHPWHIFTILITDDSPLNRDGFMEALKQKNIGTGLHYPVIHLYTYYRNKYRYRPGDFPIAENVASRIVSLPLFAHMTEAQQNRVLDAMTKVLNQ